MSERDPLPALRGLIDEPIAPRTAFADELRARLLAELGSHRPAAIDEERTMEITTPGLQLVLPGDRVRQLPSWRRIAEIAALIVLVFGVIAVFASERVGSPTNPPPTSQGNLGIYPQSFATPDPNVVNEAERDLGVLWKIPASTTDAPLADIGAFMGTTFFLEKDRVVAVDSESGSIKWQTSVARGWGLLADAQGIYVTTSTDSTGGESVLLKLSFQTGEEEWRTPVGLYPGKPILNEGIIYVWNTANTLYALSAGSGLELWNQDFSHIPMTPLAVQNYVDSAGRVPVAVLDGDSIIVGTSDARVGRIDIAGVANNHDWIWSVQLDYSKRPGFEIAIAGNTVAAVIITVEDTKFDGELIAWNRETGEELWRDETNANFSRLVSTGDAFVTTTAASTYATPTAQEFIVQGANIVNMVAYEPQTGRELWEVPDSFPVAVSVDDTIVIAGTDNVWTAAVDAKTGAVLGSTYPMGFIFSPFLVDSTALYGTRGDGMLVAIDIDALKNGTLEGGEIPGSTPEAIQSPESDSAVLWQTKPKGDVRWAGQSVISNGTVFRLLTTSDFQGVEAYDAVTGTLLWRHAVQGTELVADDSGIYVTLGRYANPEMTISATPEPFVIGPNDASVIALDPQTGNELWSTNTGTGESSPVLIDGTLYLLESADIWNVARGTTQEATAIDAATGSILWSETVGAPMGQSLAGANSRMVAADSNLVALLANGLMVGIDRTNGAVLWEQARFDPLNLGLSIDASGDTVVVSVHAATTSLNYWLPEFPELQSGSAVIAYNASDGTPLWAFDTGGVDSGIVVANDKVITKVFPPVLRADTDPLATPVGQFSETSFEIVGIDIATGDVAWQGIGGDGDRGYLYLVPSADDGSVILVDNRGYTYTVIETATGNGAQSPLHFGQPIQGAPVADSQRVYIQLEDGTIAAAALSVPTPQLSEDEVADLLPDTGNPLPASVVWHVDQDVPWPPEAFGLPLGGMAVSDGIVYRALAGFSFESEETAIAGIEAYDASSGELLWQTPLHFMSIGNTFGDSITAGDGAVYAVVNISADVNGPPTRKALIALDGRSGKERWRIEFEDDSLVTGPNYDPTQDPAIETMTYGDGVLYVANSSAVVTAFDVQTGDELWKSDAPPNRTMMSQATVVTEGSITEIQGDASEGSQVSITVSGDRIFVVTQGGSVVALDAATGEFSGEAIPSSTENTTAPVLIGNLLIVGNTVWDYSDDGFQVGKSGTLTAFDVSNNYAIAWEKQIGLSADNVVVIDDGLYVTVGVPDAAGQTTVQRFNPVDGGLIWTSEDLGQYLILRSGTGSIASVVAQSIYDGVLYTLQPVTGDIISANENIPAIAIEPGDNGYYYATLLDGALVAIGPESWAVDQNLLLTVTVTAPPQAPEPVATPDAIAWEIDGVDSEVYGGDITVTGNVLLRAVSTESGGQIDAFDSESGNPIWSQSRWWTGGIVLGDGLIYLPVIAENGISGSIIAMMPSTGETVWEQPVDGRPIVPALLGSTLFAAADSGLITALDAKTGEVLWANHALFEPANGYAAGPLPKVVGVSPKYVAALYPTGDRHNQGVLAVFDATDGKQLYQLTDYPFSSTQYGVVDDTLVILSPPRIDSESDVNGPSVLQGIDLANGDIIWENRIVTRFDEPIVVIGSARGNLIQLMAEQIETENGLYNINGFMPGESLSQETEYDYKLGVAFQIDPATSEATYVSINDQYTYKYTGPLRLPGSIAIDYSQPPVGIDQPLLAVPKGGQKYLYLLLADGSIVAVKQEAIRPG